MLQIESLESREHPSVNIYVAVWDPAPGQPPEARYFRAVIGSPQHGPGHYVDPHGGKWESIFIGA